MELPGNLQRALVQCVDDLRHQLGENLHSCILYGSAVRGDIVLAVSDLNILIVLVESTPEAHAVIADIVRKAGPMVEPFILGHRELARSFRAFAIKFRSIRRNYRVLHGADPLQALDIDEATVRFECEQVVRNLRLRTVHAFVAFGDDGRRYAKYLIGATADVFLALGEVLRLAGREIPHDYADRLPVFEQEFGAVVSMLRDLLGLKQHPRVLTAKEAMEFHGRLFCLLDQALCWIENRWPT